MHDPHRSLQLKSLAELDQEAFELESANDTIENCQYLFSLTDIPTVFVRHTGERSKKRKWTPTLRTGLAIMVITKRLGRN